MCCVNVRVLCVHVSGVVFVCALTRVPEGDTRVCVYDRYVAQLCVLSTLCTWPELNQTPQGKAARPHSWPRWPLACVTPSLCWPWWHTHALRPL